LCDLRREHFSKFHKELNATKTHGFFYSDAFWEEIRCVFMKLGMSASP
jgi:hypothetical protein